MRKYNDVDCKRTLCYRYESQKLSGTVSKYEYEMGLYLVQKSWQLKKIIDDVLHCRVGHQEAHSYATSNEYHKLLADPALSVL